MRIVLLVILFFISFAFASGINWLSFEEGLKRAKQENKLIIMDIYAKWCHWCNVIENTTYRDKRVIQIINKYYIPVRVDAEERPDINKKYNQGGLPSTVILDSDGNVLFGAIYVPPDDMVKLLKFYASLTPEEIKQEAQRVKLLSESRFKRFKKALKEKDISTDYLHKTFKYIKIRYDYKYGALKGAPKFPKTNLPYFLMLYSLFFENQQARKLALDTLLSYSKLIDKVEGGIYRYSVNEYWSEFHYEKLLKDQAELSVLYFDAYAYFGREKFKGFANSLLKFSKEKLYSPENNLFFNSQGADIVDEEGTLLITGEEYFILDEKGRKKIEEEVGYRPRIEKQFYFANNALMVKAFAYSYVFNSKPEDLLLSKKVLKKLLSSGFTKKGLKHSKNNENYYLSSQVYLLDAVLTLYQITADKNYLKLSEEIYDILNKHYFSKKLGIYVDHQDIGVNLKNISFIDDITALNAKLVRLFYLLSVLTNREKYFISAQNIAKKLPAKANLDTANAYFVIIYNPVLLRTIGSSLDKELFVKSAFKVYPYYVFTQFIDKNDRKFLEELDYIPEEKTKIYICNFKACFKTVDKTNLNKLKEEVFEIYQKLYKLQTER